MCLRRRSSGGGSGRRSGKGLRSLSAWRAASACGGLSAPPRSGRVSGRPCGFPGVWRGGWAPAAGPGPHSAQSSLPLSSPPRRVAVRITPAATVCVCVLGEIPGDAGVTVTPAQAAAAAPHLTPHPGGGDSGAKARPPGRGPGGPRGGDPQPPGGGAAARRSALCCLGLRASPSPSSRPECQTGGGDEPMTPPSRFPWKPRGGDAAPPPRSGTRRTPAALGADSPAPSSSSSSPRLIRPPPAPARVWRGVKSAQVRGPGSPPSSGHPRVLSGSQSQGYAGTAGVAGCC